MKRVLSCFVFLPRQEVLFLGADRAVPQAFGIVAGEHELDRAEEPLVEFGLLVGEALPDAVADADAAVLQLDHADGDAVDVQHQIGPALVAALQRDFFGDGEVVFSGLLPVDQVDRLGRLAGFDFDRHAVPQQVVDRVVVVVEAAVAVVRLGASACRSPR